MSNPYIIIIGLFTVVGIGTMFWGLKILLEGRRSRHWPCVKGVITVSHLNSDDDELLPEICFDYLVDKKSFNSTVQFPSGTTPTQEFSKSYISRYPVNSEVDVYYNPLRPEQATLEPGGHSSDWLIFLFGLGATVLMIFAWLTQ